MGIGFKLGYGRSLIIYYLMNDVVLGLLLGYFLKIGVNVIVSLDVMVNCIVSLKNGLIFICIFFESEYLVYIGVKVYKIK